MPKFIIRVELHGATTAEDYSKLHSAMDKSGFSRTVKWKGVSYQLPTAEYRRSGENLTSDDVLRDARAAAATVRAKPPVVVGELADSMLFVDLVPV
jgi:hypothetical protein